MATWFHSSITAISKTMEMVHMPAHTGQFETTVHSRSAVLHRNRMEWRDTECHDGGDSHKHCFEEKKAGNKRVPTTLLHSQKNTKRIYVVKSQDNPELGVAEHKKSKRTQEEDSGCGWVSVYLFLVTCECLICENSSGSTLVVGALTRKKLYCRVVLRTQQAEQMHTLSPSTYVRW